MKTNGNASLHPWGELEGGCPPSAPPRRGIFRPRLMDFKKESERKVSPCTPL